MIGLKKEMELRKKSKCLNHNEQLSIVNIAHIIDKTYNTTKRKVEVGDFTVEEAFKIFRAIGFKSKSQIEAFEYLFTEQGDI